MNTALAIKEWHIRRHRLDIKQKELAKLCEVSATHLSNVEKGRANVSMRVFNRIEDKLEELENKQ